jgi:hypothetical protein
MVKFSERAVLTALRGNENGDAPKGDHRLPLLQV